MLHRTAKLTPFGRRLLVERILIEGWSPTIAAETLGVSRATAYKWLRRYRSEGLAGLEYNAGCWAARFVAHRFVSGVEEYVTSFFVQLELTGVSRIGPNPLDVLRQNISGYQSGLKLPSDRNAFPGY